MNVLFICTGNTCRSPLAEGYLKSKNISGISVLSAGLCACGEPISKNSAAAAAEIGIDLSSHTSRPVTKELVDWADKVFCMSHSHFNMLLTLGVAREKLFILGDGIADPYGGDISVYKECLKQIIKEIDLLFKSVTVRESKMDDTDASTVAKLEKICFSAPWSATALKDSAKNGTKFFLAETNGEIAGYIGIDTVLDEGYITNIAVFPEFRKMGVASALLKYTESFANKNKLSFITLEVRVSNSAAIKLYEKHGFKKEGQRKNFYANPTEDALILTKRF
ncbi:MAG: ribosomal protein S18-alanine N-acetyltransferase [Clostridia bacterium]|nr:ribosomal protein S18-alanine N-acetyltransferase [Clostridia bacterium]